MKKAKNKPEAEALRVLILEDNRADAELIERELRRAGIVFTSLLIEGKREFKKALKEFQPQIILSDFKLPRFDGLTALEIACSLAPDIPFIFVSGSIGEEQAIDTLAHGASDYIFKDNLARLGPAVRRASEDAHRKLEKKKADEDLHRHIEELRLLAEAAEHFVQINNLDEMYSYLVQLIQDISGADYLLLSIYDENLQAVRPKIISGFEPFRETLRHRFHIDPLDMVFYLKDMRADDFGDFVSRKLLPVRDGMYGLANRKLPRPICRAIEKLLAIDAMFTMGFSWENQLFGGLTLSFKKGNELKNHALIEAVLNQTAVAIKRLLAEVSLHTSESKYRSLVTQSPDGIFIIDLQGNFLSINQSMCAGLGYSEEEFLSMNLRDIVPETYLQLHKIRLAEIMKGKSQNDAAEYEVRTKNGGIRFIAILSAPYYRDRELIGFQGIARDITEKKQMEIRLRESEEYYRTLVETSPDAIIIVDGGGRVTFASQKTIEMFGLPERTSLPGISIMDFVVPAEVSKVQERMVEILSGRSLPEIREYRLQRHDHRPFWADISSAPLRDSAGRSIGLLLICRDISQRKKIETALRESEEKYRLIADNTAETISILDLNLRFTYVSPSIFKLRGYSVEEALNQPLQQSMTAESLATIRAVFAEEMALEASGSSDPKRSRSLELREYCKDGAVIWVENTMSFLRDAQGKAIGFLAVSKDINERKLAEAVILREKAFLEALVESSPEGIAITDCPGRVLQVNEEFKNMFGFSADDIVGKMIDDLLAPPGYKEEAGTLTQSSGLGNNVALETVRKKKDGSLIHVSIIGAPIFIAGKQIAVYAIYRDISERRRAEEQIRYHAGLLQNVSDAIIATDPEGRVQAWNNAAERIYGWKAEEARGKIFHDMIKPEYRSQSRKDVMEKLGLDGVWSGELVHTIRDGRQIPVISTITMLRNAAGAPTGTVSVNHDISERKQTEDQIRASLREKEVLLQEIHHRVKNNLQIVSGLLTLQADQAGEKSIDEVFHESQDRIRSIALIHEKLYRSHNLAEIDFSQYLHDLVDNLFTSHQIDAGRILADFDTEPIVFTIEKAIPMGLIVNELVTNALKHAFPEGRRGKIHIGLHAHASAKSHALKTESGTLYRVPSYELTVADDGIGLPAGFSVTQQKTLGMKLVSMLAQQLQAELRVKTGPGIEFRLIFTGTAAGTGTESMHQQGGA